MTEYLLLIAFVFAVGFLAKYVVKVKDKNKWFLVIVFLAIFLLCALRSYTVGRDLPGYRRIYIATEFVDWDDYDYVYFESGYIFLMKICNYIGLSFQWFLAVISAVILIPLYHFIKKYSKNTFLSVLIYIGYLFFEFNMTGVRQAIGTSIVLIGLMVYMKGGKFSRIKLLAFILLAALFHNSAYVCLLFIPLSFIKKMSTYTATVSLMTVGGFLFRNQIMSKINQFFEDRSINDQAEVYIGMNFIFILAISVYLVFSYFMRENQKDGYNESDLPTKADEIQIKWFLLSCMIMLVFGLDTSVRSYMLYSQVVMTQLPNSIACWKKKDRIIINMLLVVFFIAFFFTNTLLPNNFDIVPYSFFWE